MSRNNRNRTQFPNTKVAEPVSFDLEDVDKLAEVKVDAFDEEVLSDDEDVTEPDDTILTTTDAEENTLPVTDEPVVELDAVVEPEEVKVPVYPYTDVGTWSIEELEHYISRPETMDVYYSKLVQAVARHRQYSTVINEAWSIDECVEYFKNKIEPQRTKTGCYVNDVTRPLRRETSWTTQELEAWAQGEIKPCGIVTTNGLASELHQRFKMPINSVEPEMVLAHYNYHYGPSKGTVKRINEIPVAKAVQPTVTEVAETKTKIKYAGLTEMTQTYIETALKRYCDAVRPNRNINAVKDGFPAQRELNNVIMAILKETDPVAVKSGLDMLVTVIVAERMANPRGVFSDTNAFRFTEGVTAVGNAQESHRRLLTLFFAFIDGDEGILAQTDVPELVKYLQPRQQNLLLGYFNRN